MSRTPGAIEEAVGAGQWFGHARRAKNNGTRQSGDDAVPAHPYQIGQTCAELHRGRYHCHRHVRGDPITQRPDGKGVRDRKVYRR